MRYNLNCFGIAGLIETLHETLHICVYSKKGSLFGSAIAVYESEEQKGNRISKMSCSYKS